jgi:hypothetical protein
MVEPDPIGFAYRDVIKQTVRDVIKNPDENALTLIQKRIDQYVSTVDCENVRALIMEEMRKIHEGVLARYGIYHAEFLAWKAKQRH